MKVLVSAVIVATLLQGAAAFLCYSRDLGSDYNGVVWCPSSSCFSVGGSILGKADSKKGCADKYYDFGCQAVSVLGLVSEHTCFCNSFLCNASSLPTIFLPLLILPFLLQKFL